MILTVRQSVVDPSIYKLAEEFADIVRAHAIVESGEHVVSVGDNGQAWGLLQMHPAFVRDYIHFTRITTHEPWSESEVKMCATYYRLHPGDSVDLLVQGYNLGYDAVFKEGQRSPGYLQRWSDAYQRIRAKQVRSC